MRSGERNSLLLLKADWVFPTGYFRSLGTKTRNRRADNFRLDNPPGSNCWLQHIVVERAAETPAGAHPPVELITLVIRSCPSSMQRFQKDRSREKCYISHISQSRVPFWSPMIKPRIVSC